MGWIRRLFDGENGGEWVRAKKGIHECNPPRLTRPNGGGFKYTSSEGDKWICKCGVEWCVIKKTVWPPGYKPKKGQVSSAWVHEWERTGTLWQK